MTYQMYFDEQHAKAIASFASVAGGKKDPDVLQQVRLRIKDDMAQVVATNRFVMAEMSFPSGSMPEIEVLLSPDLLKVFKACKLGVHLEFADSLDSVEATTNGVRTLLSLKSSEQYPKLDSLLPSNLDTEAKPMTQPLAISLDQLALVGKLVDYADTKYSDNHWTFYVQGDSITPKPQPVLMVRSNLKVLVQPVLNKR